MHYKDVKGILSTNNGMNLYRGCTHGCIYCDSRSVCYKMDHAFEDVAVKGNALRLLDVALRSKRKKCMIGTGAMCDPYLPLEQTECMTRRCLELIDRYGFGVSLITKSDLILRDIDLLKSIDAKTKCVVQMTITTYSEELCCILEPNVCTTRRRFEVLKILQNEGIPTVVWLSPILPFINDTEENLLGILQGCFDAGVRGIICFGMGVTLRQGNREYFYHHLDKNFPGMKKQYIRSFGNQYVCNSPQHERLMRIFHEECRARGVLHNPDKVFAYLREFQDKQAFEQMVIL